MKVGANIQLESNAKFDQWLVIAALLILTRNYLYWKETRNLDEVDRFEEKIFDQDDLNGKLKHKIAFGY